MNTIGNRFLVNRHYTVGRGMGRGLEVLEAAWVIYWTRPVEEVRKLWSYVVSQRPRAGHFCSFRQSGLETMAF